MSQTTAKTVEHVLLWIETNEHHMATIMDGGGLMLSNHHDKLRIPKAIWHKTKVVAGGRWDTRMYRATAAGRARLRRSGLVPADWRAPR